MRLNGAVHIARSMGGYTLTYIPLGQARTSRPGRTFASRKELEEFLAGPLKIGTRELNTAVNALFRNGSYCIYEVWLSEGEMEACGLGPLWVGAAAFGGLAFHAVTAAA